MINSSKPFGFSRRSFTERIGGCFPLFREVSNLFLFGIAFPVFQGEVITMYLTLQDFVILITMIVTIVAFVVDVCNKKR